MISEIVIGFVLLLLIALRVFWKALAPPDSHLLRNFPGPKKLPIFGNLLQFELEHLAMTKQYLQWHKDYGSPVHVSWGPFQAVLIAHPKHMEAIMKCNTNITKSIEYDQIVPWLGTGLLIRCTKILKDFMSIFYDQANIMVDRLNAKIRANAEAFDIVPYFSALALDIICETAMGKHLGAQTGTKSDYLDALHDFSIQSTSRTTRVYLWPDFIWNRSTSGKAANKAIKVMHHFTHRVIKERESSIEDHTTENSGTRMRRRAFLDMLLQLKREGLLTLADIREEVDTFMFEGHDTTATGMSWALYCIAAHPDVQTRLRQEILDIWDGEQALTAELLSEMRYLDCVLKESQRLLPSVPFIGRALTEDLKLDEQYTAPKGTILYITIMALHRNPEVYPEPLKFDPERFTVDNGERHPFAFLPFSGGARNCIGQRFALLEEKVVLCYLLRNFKFEAMQQFEDLDPSILLVLRPTKGVLVKVEQFA